MAEKPKILAPANGRQILFHGVEAASQSFSAGDMVYLASGKVAVCSDDSKMAVCLGLAAADATGSTSAACVVEQFMPGDLVAWDVWDTSDGAVLAAASLTVGADYGCATNSGNFYIDNDETTATVATFIKPYQKPDGSTSYRGVFRIKPTVPGAVDGD